METIGQYLKKQRELRNVQLEKISTITKISLNWLKAIEADNFDFIPAEVFAKGFVKSYAKCIGLDPAEVAIRYDEYRFNLKETAQAKPAGKPASNILAKIFNRVKKS